VRKDGKTSDHIDAENGGSTFAFSLMRTGLAREIVLIDKDEKRAKGECMDLNHGAAFVPPVKIYTFASRKPHPSG